MTLKIGIQMDHVSTINVKGDSTFALAMEAQAMGYELFHYTPDRLQLRDGKVSAAIEPMRLRDQEKDYFSLGKPVMTDLKELDVVLLRQDPPFDMSYITTTYLLERVHPQTFVVNNPVSVRNAPEKILVMDFPDLMPETIISNDFDAIVGFRKQFGDIILKPLYGSGGYGVFHVLKDDKNFFSLLEMFNASFHEPFVVQRYIADVRAGDKRIILIDGKPVGAINRIPAKDEARSNMHVGGRVEHGEITKRDQEICERIGPAMQKYGFVFAGIDVIGNYITEINVTSPTGIREIQNFSGVNIASLFWNAVTKHLGAVLDN